MRFYFLIGFVLLLTLAGCAPKDCMVQRTEYVDGRLMLVAYSMHDDLNWTDMWVNESLEREFEQNVSAHHWNIVGTKMCANKILWRAST